MSNCKPLKSTSYCASKSELWRVVRTKKENKSSKQNPFTCNFEINKRLRNFFEN